MLYLAGNTSYKLVEEIMETAVEKLEEKAKELQEAAAKHIKKDFTHQKSKKGIPKKTKKEKLAGAVKARQETPKVKKDPDQKKVGPRLCNRCKKNKPKTARSKRCFACHKEVRTRQLKRNNVTWREREAKGKAKHHITYRGKPTIWAALNPKKALVAAKEHGILEADKVKVVIQKYGKKIAEAHRESAAA